MTILSIQFLFTTQQLVLGIKMKKYHQHEEISDKFHIFCLIFLIFKFVFVFFFSFFFLCIGNVIIIIEK